MKLTKGKQIRAQRVVIYGSEGIGKSTLAAQAPEAAFIDLEDGTSNMDVARFETPKNWDDLLRLLSQISIDKDICKTVIIDTADRAEQLCIEKVIRTGKKAGIEDFGFGKGYTYVAEEWQNLLKTCDAIIASGKNVILLAHAKMRKFEQPDEMGSYDRWELKLTNKVFPLVKEWCDVLLFLNYKTYVVHNDNQMGKNKVEGGKRVIYTSHHACWDAKNRFGLPDEMEMKYENIACIFPENPPSVLGGIQYTYVEKPTEQPAEQAPEQPKEKTALETLYVLMEKDNVSVEQLKSVMAKKNVSPDIEIEQYPEHIIRKWILPNWEKILKVINGGN